MIRALLLAAASGLLLQPSLAKVVQGTMSLTSEDCEQFIAKFSFRSVGRFDNPPLLRFEFLNRARWRVLLPLVTRELSPLSRRRPHRSANTPGAVSGTFAGHTKGGQRYMDDGRRHDIMVALYDDEVRQGDALAPRL